MLDYVLAHKTCRYFFMKYAVRIHASENVSCLLELYEYTYISISKHTERVDLLTKIYNKYFSSTCETEVTISPTLKRSIESAIATGIISPTLMDDPIASINKTLQTDMWQRFLKSPEYVEMICACLAGFLYPLVFHDIEEDEVTYRRGNDEKTLSITVDLFLKNLASRSLFRSYLQSNKYFEGELKCLDFFEAAYEYKRSPHKRVCLVFVPPFPLLLCIYKFPRADYLFKIMCV
jgi:hypothetical protein